MSGAMQPWDIDVLWATFKVKYDRRFASDSEEEHRRRIFTDNMNGLLADDEAELEFTRFSDLTDDEIGARLAQARLEQASTMCKVPPPSYVGPTAEQLVNCIACIELPNAGIILEVADSLAAKDAGRGLFVRVMDGFDSVTLDENTVFCGYAFGELLHTAAPGEGSSRMEDTTVALSLSSSLPGGLSTAVFFDNQVWTLSELLSAHAGEDAGERVKSIAGHTAVFDEASGELVSLEEDAEYEGPHYFVPTDVQPSPPALDALGHLANDLAVEPSGWGAGCGEATTYYERSQSSNLLVLMHTLERHLEAPGTLRPTAPILTLARAVTFTNVAPMELGVEYGHAYWDAQTLQGQAEAFIQPDHGRLARTQEAVVAQATPSSPAYDRIARVPAAATPVAPSPVLPAAESDSPKPLASPALWVALMDASFDVEGSEALIIRDFLSASEVASVFKAGEARGAMPGVSNLALLRDAGLGQLVKPAVCDELRGVAHDIVFSSEHVALYLHRNRYIHTQWPQLWNRLEEGMRTQSGSWGSAATPLSVRCCELHTYACGGSLLDATHTDEGSSLTLSVLLAAPVSGGEMLTYNASGGEVVHQMSVGDALLFHSEKRHNVAQVTGGMRRSLVVELWAAPPNVMDRYG